MKLNTCKLTFSIITVVIACLTNITATAQSTWFADGFHGGIYGHYPLWVTQFIASTSKVAGKTSIRLAMPRFAIRTIRLVNTKK